MSRNGNSSGNECMDGCIPFTYVWTSLAWGCCGFVLRYVWKKRGADGVFLK